MSAKQKPVAFLDIPGVRVRMVRTTPEMAAAWLANKAPNRPINNNDVDMYAGEMTAGRWGPSNDAICFNQNGQLINGQHRLSAQVKAGIVITWVIAENLDDDAINRIDVGGIRKAPDVETIRYGTTHARFKISLINGIRMSAFNTKGRLSAHRRHELIALMDETLEWATVILRHGGVARPAAVSSALAFAYWKNPAAVDDFTAKLISGADLKETSPALLLRNYLLFTRDATSAARRQETFLKVLSMVRAHIGNRSMTKLQAVKDPAALLAFFAQPELEEMIGSVRKGGR